MLEAQDKKRPGYSRFLVPGNEHGRDAHVTLEVVKQLLNLTLHATSRGAHGKINRKQRCEHD
jgi:hypothetical protein